MVTPLIAKPDISTWLFSLQSVSNQVESSIRISPLHRVYPSYTAPHEFAENEGLAIGGPHSTPLAHLLSTA